MKKVLSILVSLIFLLTTSHLTLSQHFCYGNLLNTEILLGSHPSHCGMEENHPSQNHGETAFQQHCCQNVLQQLEVSGESQITHFHFDFKAFFVAFNLNNFKLVLLPSALNHPTHFNTKYTVPPPDIPIYKRVEVFLI